MGTYTNLSRLKPLPLKASPSVPVREVDTGSPVPAFSNSASADESRTEKRTEFRSEKRSFVLPVKRRTKRYSFEFYEDQILKLKQLKYEAEVAGENVKLSDFAREALDLYLQDK